MKMCPPFSFWRLIASIVCLHASAPGQSSIDDLLAMENLGGLKIGVGEKQLAPFLGKAVVKKSALVLEAATGEYFQTWTIAEKGLAIRMTSGESKTGGKHVAGFTATAKCGMATSKGIKIGSPMAEVRKAYGAFEDKENPASENSFVAGSIYGGIIFTFKDGKVSEIFFGAAAE